MAKDVPTAKTKRDILQQIKVAGDSIADSCNGLASGAITAETFDSTYTACTAAITSLMGQYETAEP